MQGSQPKIIQNNVQLNVQRDRKAIHIGRSPSGELIGEGGPSMMISPPNQLQAKNSKFGTLRKDLNSMK